MCKKATFFMRVYNINAEWLRRAVESVLNQTNHNLRFIIQDNGSTDGTYEILCDYARMDARIGLVRNELNSCETYEECMKRWEVFYKNFNEFGADYFAFIDSDDYYADDFLDKAIQTAESQKADIVFCGYKQIDTNQNILTQKLPNQVSCNVRQLEKKDFVKGYAMIRTFWGNLYSAPLWERYWSLIEVEKPTYLCNGADTYINLSLLKESKRIAFLGESLYSQTVHMISNYRTDLRTNRIKEADDLFLKGIEVAQYCNILDEEMITFLASVYYYHIEDFANAILTSGIPNLLEMTINAIEQSEIYQMLAEKSSDLKKLEIILRQKGSNQIG